MADLWEGLKMLDEVLMITLKVGLGVLLVLQAPSSMRVVKKVVQLAKMHRLGLVLKIAWKVASLSGFAAESLIGQETMITYVILWERVRLFALGGMKVLKVLWGNCFGSDGPRCANL